MAAAILAAAAVVTAAATLSSGGTDVATVIATAAIGMASSFSGSRNTRLFHYRAHHNNFKVCWKKTHF